MAISQFAPPQQDDPEQLIQQMLAWEQSPWRALAQGIRGFGRGLRGEPELEADLPEAQMARHLKLAQGLSEIQGKKIDRLTKGLTLLGDLSKSDIDDETYTKLSDQVIGALHLPKELGQSVQRKRAFMGDLYRPEILREANLTPEQIGGLVRQAGGKLEDVQKLMARRLLPTFQERMNTAIAGGATRERAAGQVMEQYPYYRTFQQEFGLKIPEASAEMLQQEEKLKAVRTLWPELQKLPVEQIETILGLLNVDASKLIGTRLKGAGARAETYGRQAGEAQAYQDPSISASLAAQKGREAGATAAAQAPYQIAVSAAQGREAAGIAATKPLAEATAARISEINTILEQIVDLRKVYKPEFVGFVSGRLGAIGETVTGRISKEEIETRQLSADMSDSLLRARSGAQINEQEFARLKKLVPQPNDPSNVFEVKLGRFERSLQQLREQKLKTATTGRQQLREESAIGAKVPKTNTPQEIKRKADAYLRESP